MVHGSTPQTQGLPDPAELSRVAKRIVDLLDEEDALETPLKRLYSRTTARVFADFCDVLSLDRSAINLNSRAAKKALFSLLITEVNLTTPTLSYHAQFMPASVERNGLTDASQPLWRRYRHTS